MRQRERCLKTRPRLFCDCLFKQEVTDYADYQNYEKKMFLFHDLPPVLPDAQGAVALHPLQYRKSVLNAV